MSQSSPSIGANKSGLAYRGEDNAGKTAMLSSHKGSTAPSYAVAGMIWCDDTGTPWLYKMYDGADWITFGALNATNNTFAPYLGTGAIKFVNFVADTGAANAYVLTPVPAISAYIAGQMYTLIPSAANTGAATCAVSGFSAKSIKLPSGANPHANAMLAGGVYTLVYDGTNLILLNPSYAFGTAAFLSVGTGANQIVQLNGSGELPAVSGANLTSLPVGASKLVAVYAPAADTEFIIGAASEFDAAFPYYVLKFNLLKSSAAANFRLQTSTDGGSSWAGSANNYRSSEYAGIPTTAESATTYMEMMQGSQPNSTNQRFRGELAINNMLDANGYPYIHSDVAHFDVGSGTGGSLQWKRRMTRLAAAAQNALRFYVASGTMTGIAHLYAYKGTM